MARSLIDPNRKATLIAKSDTDNDEIVEVTANPLTGAINVDTVASIGTQYESGDETPATPIGTITVFDKAGTITHVSDTNPLPVSASIDTSGLATEAKQLPDGHNVTVDNAGGGAAVPIQDGGNTITVDGTVTANLGATDNAVLDQIELNQDAQTALLTTIDADTGNLPTIETNTDFGTVKSGGNETNALRVTIANNSTGLLSVDDNGGSLSVDDNGGSLTVDGTVAVTNSGITTIAGAVSGTEMQVDVVAALPTGDNKIGNVELYDAFGNDLVFRGAMMGVLPYGNPDVLLSGTASATGTSNTALIAAQGSGVITCITSIIICNTSATDTFVTIKDGSTAKLVYPAPAGGGAVHTLAVPLKSTANTAINFASGASVTTMYVSALAFKI